MSKLVTAVAVAVLGSGSLQAAPIARNAVAQGDAAFVTSADGTLAALDATSGAVRWSSPMALRPLAVHSARVLAQAAAPAGRLALVVLEARTGRLLAQATVALPDGVTTPLDDTGDTRFAIDATPDGARVRLEWAWDFRPMRGIYEEDGDEGEETEREERGPRHVEGALLVDLGSASATAVASRRVTGPPALPAVVARAADGGAFRERPLAAGAFLVATQGRGDALVLKRWRDGSARPDVGLPAESTLQLASAEGGHVLVSRELSGAPLDAAHEWTVVALDSGARVATLRTSTAAAGFAVAADRVLVAHEAWEHRTASGWRREPRRVEAFDRTTGALAWTREIRDGRYSGPVAP